jgi:hypothetical protein
MVKLHLAIQKDFYCEAKGEGENNVSMALMDSTNSKIQPAQTLQLKKIKIKKKKVF